MRIGLFGGTFNPVHNGHLKAVYEVQKRFALDKSYIIPSAIPPHKEQDGVVDAKDRIEMIRLAVSSSPDIMKSVVISDVELKRSGPSYTIDTVFHFKSILPEDSRIYFILGLDAFLEIDTWKSYMDLFLLTSFIVITRFPAEQNDISIMRKSLENYLQNRISLNYKYSYSQSCYVNDERKPVFFFDVNPLNISSTRIRTLVSMGRSIRLFVPEKVDDLIKTKGLYL